MDDTSKIVPMMRRMPREELRRKFSRVSWTPQGRVHDVVGTVIEAHIPSARLGAVVTVNVPGMPDGLPAEIVGFRGDKVLLLPYGQLTGISPGCLISGQRMLSQMRVGDHLLGRIIDPFGHPLDTGTVHVPEFAPHVPIEKAAPNPMERARIERPLSLGIRAIDGLLTFGEGQRLGIMAGSGVGKSVLMGMIAKQSAADINVIALIGERGREVREFIERDLGPEGLKRSIVIVVTGDQSPLMRIRGAKAATAVAEHFSSQGRRVLLMMDSLTRVAMAQREIGLAIGEPPTTKGYTPSVFRMLPQLLERAGPQAGGRGSISGLYTVLVDGDDFNDPIPDAVRSILDGHINLSRDLASKGHFPAIEVTTSASRVMFDIVSKEHWDAANRFRALLGIYRSNYDLYSTGAYQRGMNPDFDLALALMPALERYLKQDIDEVSNTDDAIHALVKVLAPRLYPRPIEEQLVAG